jgi:hypothetical protein
LAAKFSYPLMSHYRPECFVIAPIGGDPAVTEVYRDDIKPAVESLGIQCVRADEAHFTRPIMEEVLDRISRAYFIVADLTNERPNCYYELGVAHARGQTVIHIIDKTTRKHFDVQGYPFIEFGEPKQLRRKLREHIVKLVLTTKGSDDDDFRLGRFGRCAWRNGRLLTAEIVGRGKTRWNVRILVYATPRWPELNGSATFYYDRTVEPLSETVKVKNGIAETMLSGIMGGFTVGARCDDGKTNLELDLSRFKWPIPTP